jgi:site-specific DNA recombinase
MRAATYARLSDDGLSIPDQQCECRRYAQDRSWEVVGEFKEESRSAFRKVEREGFEALLAAANAGKIDVIIARHQDRLTRHPETYGRLLEVCVRHGILIHLYTGGVLDLATHAGGFLGMMNTAVAWGESKLRSDRVKAAVARNVAAGKRTGGGSRPFGYKIIRRDTGVEGRPQYRIIGEELKPAEAELIKEAAARVLRGESLRSIAMDWNERGIKPAGGSSTKTSKDGRKARPTVRWQGSMIRRVLISARIAGLREHHGQVFGEAAWPAIIDRATHDRVVALLKDERRRPANYDRPRKYLLTGLVYCGSCEGPMVSLITRNQGRGYGCRKDENPECPARVRIAGEPVEEWVTGYVIDQWRNPRTRKIAQSDEDRMQRIQEISDELARLQEQKDEALEMRLRREVDAQTCARVMKKIDARRADLDREHKKLASEASMPKPPDPSASCH